MLAKVKSVINSRNGTAENNRSEMLVDAFDNRMFSSAEVPQSLYPYTRPEFLHLNDEEIALSADPNTRPVLCPKYPLTAFAGYAEVCNGGKSKQNEDSASAKVLSVMAESQNYLSKLTQTRTRPVRVPSVGDEEILSMTPNISSDEESNPQVQATYFGLFDGHDGSGCSAMTANCLHEHIKNRLNGILYTALNLPQITDVNHMNEITTNSLVIGALQVAFSEMDDQIAEMKTITRLSGGTTALCALFFLNRLYIVNAGDSRAILVTPTEFQQLSTDMNPQNDRKRLQYLAYQHRDLISPQFTRYEFSRSLTRKDLKSNVLYRDWWMDGWATKIVTEADLKPQFISSHFKKSRLLNTIGVSRGLGDHHLMTYDNKIRIKPFLSCAPEVTVLDPSTFDRLSDDHVLIMATDGLFDIFSNADVALIARQSLGSIPSDDMTRYTQCAQELLTAARGELHENSRWKLSAELKVGTPLDGSASMDDITVFVIPLKFAFNMPNGGLDSDDEELLSC
ncbi:PPM-type phosphatase domain-containing protein [Aphelenchoides besseyi]|nr:PPM-type phosphatase domain-containing protein [Aphelenchoides besseyi]KAI6200829.1 PPM-type phosphatase domain-containing protein [Aphelenchoides besseyi]